MAISISEMTKLWGKALSVIETKLHDRNLFTSFFEGGYIEDIKGDTITLVVNSKLGVQLISKNYMSLISDVVYEIADKVYKFHLVTEADIKKDVVFKDKPSTKNTSNSESTYFKNAKINRNSTFDNFVVGSFNKEASQASLIIAKNPGKMFNPLFIHSNSGLGKTHLLHAVGNYVLNEKPDAKILYITANDFVEEYIKYVRADKDSESLKDFFRDVDILLFDDVQFLADKVKTEEMFFYIYSRMINDGKQIIITSDKQPNELKNLEDRLVTRFSQGLVVKIDEPDINTCVEILKKKIASSGFNPDKVDVGVLHFFADKFSRNVRELEGALNRLIFYAVNIKQTDVISLDVAIEACNSLVGGKSIASSLNEEKIINIVADYYNLTPNQLKSKVRTGQIALARHIAMYLIRYTLDVPLKKIGDSFGGKDHTTVMNAISKVEKELKTDGALKVAVDELKARVKK